MFSAQCRQIFAFRSPACWLYPLKPGGEQKSADVWQKTYTLIYPDPILSSRAQIQALLSLGEKIQKDKKFKNIKDPPNGYYSDVPPPHIDELNSKEMVARGSPPPFEVKCPLMYVRVRLG
jgi:hypothetical protein